MERILKLFNRIDRHLQSKNTQELILDLGDSTKAVEKLEVVDHQLQEELIELQEWLDTPEAVSYIQENFETFTETFDSVYFHNDIDLEKLKSNSAGKEELYNHIIKIIEEKKSHY